MAGKKRKKFKRRRVAVIIASDVQRLGWTFVVSQLSAVGEQWICLLTHTRTSLTTTITSLAKSLIFEHPCLIQGRRRKSNSNLENLLGYFSSVTGFIMATLRCFYRQQPISWAIKILITIYAKEIFLLSRAQVSVAKIGLEMCTAAANAGNYKGC